MVATIPIRKIAWSVAAPALPCTAWWVRSRPLSGLMIDSAVAEDPGGAGVGQTDCDATRLCCLWHAAKSDGHVLRRLRSSPAFGEGFVTPRTRTPPQKVGCTYRGGVGHPSRNRRSL